MDLFKSFMIEQAIFFSLLYSQDLKFLTKVTENLNWFGKTLALVILGFSILLRYVFKFLISLIAVVVFLVGVFILSVIMYLFVAKDSRIFDLSLTPREEILSFVSDVFQAANGKWKF